MTEEQVRHIHKALGVFQRFEEIKKFKSRYNINMIKKRNSQIINITIEFLVGFNKKYNSNNI